MVGTKSEFTRRLIVDPWPEDGITVDLEADAAEREALARRFGLIAIRSLVGRGRLERSDERELRFLGRLEAEVVQTCVVSLEPVPATVSAPIERRYRRDGEVPGSDEREVVIDPDAVEVEALDGRSLDLGEALAEELGLALEPYPRADDAYALIPELSPGVSFGEAEDEDDDEETTRPFARLRDIAAPRAQ